MISKVETSENEVVLKITDPTAEELRTELQAYLDEVSRGQFKIITLDLSDLKAMQSSILGKILMFRKKTLEEGRVLQIRGCSEELYRIFQSIKLDSVLSIQK
jgi:anti-anti-sigma regulatory factor